MPAVFLANGYFVYGNEWIGGNHNTFGNYSVTPYITLADINSIGNYWEGFDARLFNPAGNSAASEVLPFQAATGGTPASYFPGLILPATSGAPYFDITGLTNIDLSKGPLFYCNNTSPVTIATVSNGAGGALLQTFTLLVVDGFTSIGGLVSPRIVPPVGISIPFLATALSVYSFQYDNAAGIAILVNTPFSYAASGDLTGNYPAPTLVARGPGAGTYTVGNRITPVTGNLGTITIDAQGRVIAIQQAT
jgi:hypothetical protein